MTKEDILEVFPDWEKKIDEWYRRYPGLRQDTGCYDLWSNELYETYTDVMKFRREYLLNYKRRAKALCNVLLNGMKVNDEEKKKKKNKNILEWIDNLMKWFDTELKETGEIKD